MMNDVTALDAKARLAVSRAELLAAMGYEQFGEGADSGGSAAGILIPIADAGRISAAAALSRRVGRSVVGRWWRRHPVSSVAQLTRPYLEKYARKHPAKLVAYGAGTGALFYFIKPWRLLSVATVVSVVLKSSDISGIVSELMNSSKSNDAEDAGALPFPTTDSWLDVRH